MRHERDERAREGWPDERREGRAAVAPANRARVEEAQQTGEFRDDLEPKQTGVFVSVVLNGLALHRASGEELPSVGLVLGLLQDAIGGRAQPRSSGGVSP